MVTGFKYLRIALAIILPLFCIALFLKDFIFQIQFKGFDGPLAHYTSYTFSFNRIVLASFLSIILLFDFKLNLPTWGVAILRIIGVGALLVSVLALFFLIRQIIFMGGFFEHEYLFLSIQQLFFQITYLMISVVIFGIAFDKNWARMKYKENDDA